MPINSKGKVCGRGFRGYPCRPRRTRREMLNLLELLFGRPRESIKRECKKMGIDLSSYDYVCRYIKGRIKDLIRID